MLTSVIGRTIYLSSDLYFEEWMLKGENSGLSLDPCS